MCGTRECDVDAIHGRNGTGKSRRSKTRGGLSLLELLVVIAIISIVVGLTLSAVQKVRMAGARAKCANQMRQLALALHAYHDAKGQLPPGISGDRTPEPYLSWLARVLPHVEQ